MRVVIADDVMIVRSGLAGLLRDGGVEVVGEAGDVAGLLTCVAVQRPDVALVDIRMPPTHRDEGLIAAERIRSQYPHTAVLVLSEYLEPRYATRLMTDSPDSVGYLLKGRVSNLETLLDALNRVVAGECVIDPGVLERLHRRGPSPLDRLTVRERQTLLLIAEGRSNSSIAARLGIGERTVESMCAQVFRKLEIEPDPEVNRRVLAVLTLLRPPVTPSQ